MVEYISICSLSSNDSYVIEKLLFYILSESGYSVK